MISLVVEDYCQNCPEFDPAIGRDDKYEFTTVGQIVEERYTRTVECSHRRRCASMADYIRKEMETKDRGCDKENAKQSSITLTCNCCDYYSRDYWAQASAPCKLRNEMVLGEGVACKRFLHTIDTFEGGKK